MSLDLLLAKLAAICANPSSRTFSPMPAMLTWPGAFPVSGRRVQATAFVPRPHSSTKFLGGSHS
jgi:hypothetical protein